MRAAYPQEPPSGVDRQSEGGVVERLRHRGEQSADGELDCVDPAGGRRHQQRHAIADIDAEVTGQPRTEQDAIAIAVAEGAAAIDHQRAAERRFEIRTDRFPDERYRRVAVARETREIEPRSDDLDARRGANLRELRRVRRQQVFERIGPSKLVVTGTDDLQVTEMRPDRRLAQVVINPFDEAARQHQCDNSEGNGRNRHGGPAWLAKKIAQCEPRHRPWEPHSPRPEIDRARKGGKSIAPSSDTRSQTFVPIPGKPMSAAEPPQGRLREQGAAEARSAWLRAWTAADTPI